MPQQLAQRSSADTFPRFHANPTRFTRVPFPPSPKGYEELSRCKVLDPTGVTFGRDVVWSHPAFAQRCMFARNDKEIVCVSLAREDDRK